MDIFLKKDPLNNWNTVPPVPVDKIGNVNCHKFILYIIGKISWEDMVSDVRLQKESGIDFTFGETARNISNTEFTTIKDLPSLILIANKNCKIYKAEVVNSNTIIKKEPGETETDGKTYLNFTTSDGMISVEELQMEGKKRMEIKEFLRGNKL